MLGDIAGDIVGSVYEHRSIKTDLLFENRTGF
jgi:ADP-ribosylglycohydrolase